MNGASQITAYTFEALFTKLLKFIRVTRFRRIFRGYFTSRSCFPLNLIILFRSMQYFFLDLIICRLFASVEHVLLVCQLLSTTVTWETPSLFHLFEFGRINMHSEASCVSIPLVLVSQQQYPLKIQKKFIVLAPILSILSVLMV